MFKKKCSNCRMVLDKNWNFCPACGMPLNAQNQQVNSINIDLSNLNKVFQPMITSLMSNMMGGMFQNQQPVQKEKTSLHEKFTKNVSNVNEVIEPED